MIGGELTTQRVVKPWGRLNLPAPFVGDEREPVGEIWFDPPPALDAILAKYLFTEEKLSVQVHPTQALSPTGRGKEECWLVLDAQPGACLAAGFKEPLSAEAMRAAALDGSIEELLAWHSAKPGDLIEIPAGTVHAIGAGLTLLEIQQNTDITYRLFDYGRPRELHLDEAIEAGSGDVHPARLRRSIDPAAETMLVDGEHYRMAQCQGAPADALRTQFTDAVQVMPLEGKVIIGGRTIECGSAGWAEKVDAIDFSLSGRNLLIAL